MNFHVPKSFLLRWHCTVKHNASWTDISNSCITWGLFWFPFVTKMHWHGWHLVVQSQQWKQKNKSIMCKICSKLTIKTSKWRHWRCSCVFFVKFEHISVLFWCFLCQYWTSKCWVGIWKQAPNQSGANWIL